jgi:hypothetical protein
MAEDMMGLRLQEFARADAAQRQHILDQAIDEFESRPNRGERRRPTTAPGPRWPGPPGGDRASRFRQRMQSGNPQRQAQMAEFFPAVQERRRQRGLSPAPTRR